MANVFHSEEICQGLNCDLSKNIFSPPPQGKPQNELVLDKFILATGSKFLLSAFIILIPASRVHFSWFPYDLPILTPVL